MLGEGGTLVDGLAFQVGGVHMPGRVWGSDTPISRFQLPLLHSLQLKKLDLAAAAAHTFFVANPTHLQMREDMAKYRRMSAIRPQSFRDLETLPHWVSP